MDHILKIYLMLIFIYQITRLKGDFNENVISTENYITKTPISIANSVTPDTLKMNTDTDRKFTVEDYKTTMIQYFSNSTPVTEKTIDIVTADPSVNHTKKTDATSTMISDEFDARFGDNIASLEYFDFIFNDNVTTTAVDEISPNISNNGSTNLNSDSNTNAEEFVTADMLETTSEMPYEVNTIATEINIVELVNGKRVETKLSESVNKTQLNSPRANVDFEEKQTSTLFTDVYTTHYTTSSPHISTGKNPANETFTNQNSGYTTTTSTDDISNTSDENLQNSSDDIILLNRNEFMENSTIFLIPPILQTSESPTFDPFSNRNYSYTTMTPQMDVTNRNVDVPFKESVEAHVENTNNSFEKENINYIDTLGHKTHYSNKFSSPPKKLASRIENVPAVTAMIDGTPINFTIHVVTKNGNFYVPSDSTVQNFGDSSTHISWPSVHTNILTNDSLKVNFTSNFAYFQLKLNKDGDFVVYEKNIAPTNNSKFTVSFDDGVEMHFFRNSYEEQHNVSEEKLSSNAVFISEISVGVVLIFSVLAAAGYWIFKHNTGTLKVTNDAKNANTIVA